jgi:hypothetical protein
VRRSAAAKLTTTSFLFISIALVFCRTNITVIANMAITDTVITDLAINIPEYISDNRAVTTSVTTAIHISDAAGRIDPGPGRHPEPHQRRLHQ